MGKRGQKSNKKKGEFYFNFNKLRHKLNNKQKEKLVKFFGNFRTMFLTVKEHLFQVNKMYDLMEQEYKKFQKDLFKNDEYLSGPNQMKDEEKNENANEEEEFLIDDDVLKQIIDEGFKDGKEKQKDNTNLNSGDNTEKNLLEKYDLDLGKESFEKENKNENENGNNKKEDKININNEFSQEFFEWRKKN
jgi:hypothetical protein